MINFLKRKIHQEEMNDFLARNYKYQGLDFVSATLTQFHINLKLVGQENVPSTGGCIVAANHPLGGLDGLALIKAVSTVRAKKDVKFIVNDILLNLKNLAELFVPVNKHGKNSAEVLATIEDTYESNQAVLVFPAGLVSRKQDGKIKDLEWKKSFITQARKHQKDIIPVFIEGQNSNFFYNFALLRKKLGIKANIEMFFLVDEMFRQKNKSITIIFGKPIPYTHFDKSKTDQEWARELKELVYQIGKDYASNN